MEWQENIVSMSIHQEWDLCYIGELTIFFSLLV